MTERGAYEAILTELRKNKAPHVHLEDFIYFMNKGIQEFINEEYNRFETTQQTSDALNSITSWCNFKFNYANVNNPTVTITGNTLTITAPIAFLKGERYNSKFVQVNLPNDYLHILNCVTDVKTLFNYSCFGVGYMHSFGSKKLNADSASSVMSNAWLRPEFNRTFFKMLDHANTSGALAQANNIILSPDVQVFYGKSSKFNVDNIFIEYLRKPKIVSLTENQIDLPNDTSAQLDFTDYVCNEIIKRIVKLILENSKDQRIQTFVPVNSSVKQ
jgi:hypothetical protein